MLVLIGSENPRAMEVTQQQLSRVAKSGFLRLPQNTPSSDPRWTVKKNCGHFLVNGCHLLPLTTLEWFLFSSHSKMCNMASLHFRTFENLICGIKIYSYLPQL